MLEQDILEVLLTSEEIHLRCQELGKQIAQDYQGKKPLLVGVLKGAVPFLSDLMQAIDLDLEIDFMDVSSYGDATVSSGEVKIVKDLDTNVQGRHILIVEDILDSGQTLAYLRDLFNYRQAESVKIAALLDKREGRLMPIEADYVGFDVPNKFVVGYGLDFAEKYRNLPYVGVLKPEVYE